MQKLILTGLGLTLEDISQVARNFRLVSLAENARESVIKSCELLREKVKGEPGKLADLVILVVDDYSEVPYRIAENLVNRVIIEGIPV